MPSQVTTPGRLLLADIVPEDMRPMLDTPMDKKALKAFFLKLAKDHPDQYQDVMANMADLANETGTAYGRWTSISLADLRIPPAARIYRDQVRKEIHAISQNPSLSSQDKSRIIVDTMKKHIDPLRKLVEEDGVRQGNALAYSTRYGFRGNPVQLGQMLVGDMLIADNNGKPIPLPVLHSYSEGLSPLETFAGSYGSRQGYMCLAGNTQVRMADGTSRAIRDILPGESVLGANTKGETGPAKVLALLDQGERFMWRYVFRGEDSFGDDIHLDCTEEHRVLQYPTRRSRVPRLRPIGRPDVFTEAAIVGGRMLFDYRTELGDLHAYDLSIDNDSHLFVLANGMIVSNSVQFATADTGYFAKQLRLLASGQTISGEDCGTKRGILVSPGSKEAAGRVLAAESGSLQPGTLLTSDSLRKLRDPEVSVRSPLTCEMPHGVCRKCAGLRPDGKWPRMGEYIGLEAAGFMTEPMTQKLALCLHPDTQVRMGTGDAKPLRDIVAGDCVMGTDRSGRTFPVEVLNVWHNGPKPLFLYTYRRNPDEVLCLRASADHRIWSTLNGITGLHPAGDEGKPKAALHDHTRCPLVSAEPLGMVDTMDLEVDHPDHMFMLANGLVVENSAKHIGGAVGVTDADAQGFAEIDQFLQIPETFKGAVHTETDGTVAKVEKAPQGGTDIWVGDERYHLPAGRTPSVKRGDTVFAGDPLSDGTQNPRLVARYRGIGAGRKYFSDKLSEILDRNGVPLDRSNVDVVTRAYIANVRVTDPDGAGGYKFGEVVPYDHLQHSWKPRPGSEETAVDKAAGRYLETPVLHYSIGTRLTPAVVADLRARKVASVLSHPSEPGFEPYIVRAAARTVDEPDWKQRMGGFYLKKAYGDMAALGAADEPHGQPSVFAGLLDPNRLQPVTD